MKIQLVLIQSYIFCGYESYIHFGEDGLVVNGEDLKPSGRGFESWRWILDGI